MPFPLMNQLEPIEAQIIQCKPATKTQINQIIFLDDDLVDDTDETDGLSVSEKYGKTMSQADANAMLA